MTDYRNPTDQTRSQLIHEYREARQPRFNPANQTRSQLIHEYREATQPRFVGTYHVTSTFPPPPPPALETVPAEPHRSLGSIFMIVFWSIWALTALNVIVHALQASSAGEPVIVAGLVGDVMLCAANGAGLGGIVVLIVWLVRKVRAAR